MASFSQSKIAAMKNVLADCVGVESRGKGLGPGWYCPGAPSDHPIPHARPGVGYVCGLWVLPGRYNIQSKRANADCAEFAFTLFSILSSIILW